MWESLIIYTFHVALIFFTIKVFLYFRIFIIRMFKLLLVLIDDEKFVICQHFLMSSFDSASKHRGKTCELCSVFIPNGILFILQCIYVDDY